MTIELEMFTPTLAGLVSYPYPIAMYAGGPWRSGSWRFATEGHLIIGERVSDDCALPSPPERLSSGAPKFLEPAVVHAFDVSMADMRAAAGAVFVPDTEECAYCGGGGRIGEGFPCEHCEQMTRATCDDCDGSGCVAVRMPDRYVRIAGVPVNWPYIAYALAAVSPCETVHVGSLDVGAGKVLILDGDGWRIGLMQINDLYANGISVWPR